MPEMVSGFNCSHALPFNIDKRTRRGRQALRPIFDSQRRFLLERCSPGAASRAIKVPGPQKCSAISLPKFFSILL